MSTVARKYKQRERPVYLNHVRCPECGVAMAERTRTRFGEDGEAAGSMFYGCARFPLCVGTRPISGLGFDSYTKLLQTAYTKALVFLSSPKFFGVNAASVWMLSHAMEMEEGELVLPPCEPCDLVNAALERGIDAACEYVADHGIDQDFLVLAHEERMESIRARLKFSTKPGTIRSMPKAEIQRRYDTGTIAQFEATLAEDWVNDGQHCPRCGQWAQAVQPIEVPTNAQDWFDKAFSSAMDELVLSFDCTACGQFTKVKDSYMYLNDALDPGCVPGATFQNRQRRK